MWSDNESALDYLGFQHLVTAITTIVQNDDLLPATVGVYGDWGSGKSSLIRMVEQELNKDEGIVILSFNGWLFEGYEDAKTALMGTVLEELLENQKFLAKAGAATKRQLTQLLKRVNKLKIVGAIGKLAYAAYSGDVTGVGVGLSGGIDLLTAGKQALSKAKDVDLGEVNDYLEEQKKEEKNIKQSARRSIREFRQDFEKLLKTSKIKTLIIMIDDLDRCDPTTIIETLEAIKLFLFVPGTAFILGADERLIRYAVRRRFPELPGERFEVGRDYLEKLIQFPIRIPSLGRGETESYINLLFTKLSSLSNEQKEKARECVIECEADSLFGVNFDLAIAQKIFDPVPDDLAEHLALAQRIAPLLTSGLNGNPRQYKRFLNTLIIRLGMARSRKLELKQRVLAKLMLLEYVRLEYFKKLAELQGEQMGRPIELLQLEQSLKGRSKIRDDAEPTPEIEKASESQIEQEQAPPLGAEFKLWLSDNWTRSWINLDPMLSSIDLRPYFYFSQDRLGAISGEAQRLSPVAQETLFGLLHESEAVQKIALGKAQGLTATDAAAVFEAIILRIEQEEDLGSEHSAFMRIFDWVKVRPELLSQFITFLGRLPVTSLPPVTVLRVIEISKGTTAEDASYQLIERWSQNNSNIRLANIAISRLSFRTN